MSKREQLRDIEEQKCLLVAKANLQRSTLLMLASPLFKTIPAVEVGVFAARTGRAIVRHMKD